MGKGIKVSLLLVVVFIVVVGLLSKWQKNPSYLSVQGKTPEQVRILLGEPTPESYHINNTTHNSYLHDGGMETYVVFVSGVAEEIDIDYEKMKNPPCAENLGLFDKSEIISIDNRDESVPKRNLKRYCRVIDGKRNIKNTELFWTLYSGYYPTWVALEEVSSKSLKVRHLRITMEHL